MKERGILESALGSFLTADQAKAAMKPLGTFNRQWDFMVDALAGLGVDADKTSAALGTIRTFVVSVADISAQRQEGDRDAMTEALRKARATLHEGLVATLTEEQATKVEQAAGRMGAGRGGRGERGGGPPA